MTWIACPGCGLKHTPRPDGLCPRCRTRVAVPGAEAGGAAPAGFPGAAHSFPEPPAAPTAPLPTRAVGAHAPPPTTPIHRGDGPALAVGSLVNRTFAIWWANVGKFTSILVLAYLPIVVAGALGAAAVVALEGGAPRIAEPGLIAVLLVALLAAVFFGLVNFGGVTFGTLQHLAGRPFTFGSMFGAGLRRAWPLFTVGLAGSLLVLLGLVALVIPGIIVALGLAVAYPVVVAERVTTSEAIKRSFALTKGSRDAIFGALFVVMLAMWGATLAGNLLTAALKSAGPAAIVATILTLLVQAAMSALSTVLCAVAYHDLRLAKEGTDTTELVKVFE